MTLHSDVNFKCKQCGTSYIPIPEFSKCPKCGHFAETVFAKFIDDARHAASYHIGTYGSVVPAVWGEWTTGDRYYWIAFHFIAFAAHELNISETNILSRKFNDNDVQSLTTGFLKISDFKEMPYLVDYVKIFLTRYLQ